eukprot:Skav235562  [mRNA]  locus=scaffold3067:372523:376401:- [translate_table: standard]
MGVLLTVVQVPRSDLAFVVFLQVGSSPVRATPWAGMTWGGGMQDYEVTPSSQTFGTPTLTSNRGTVGALILLSALHGADTALLPSSCGLIIALRTVGDGIGGALGGVPVEKFIPTVMLCVASLAWDEDTWVMLPIRSVPSMAAHGWPCSPSLRLGRRSAMRYASDASPDASCAPHVRSLVRGQQSIPLRRLHGAST